MTRYLLSFGLACGLVAGAGYLSLGARAEDKKEKEPREKAAAPTESMKAAQALTAANTIARVGRETKSPLLLLAAAKTVGTTKFGKFDVSESKLESKNGEFDVLDYTTGLIKEARDLAKDDAAFEALAKKTEDEIKKFNRGAAGGAKVWRGHLEKGYDTTDDYYCTFVGGSPAFVGVTNHTNRGDIDLYIYNSKTGQLIGRDIRKDDDCSYSWNPPQTVSVRIRVRAYAGSAPMRYTIQTN
jgi:hypothetical protein